MILAVKPCSLVTSCHILQPATFVHYSFHPLITLFPPESSVSIHSTTGKTYGTRALVAPNRHRVSSKHSRFSFEFQTTNYEHANDTRPWLYVPYATLACQGQSAIDSVDTERRCVHPTAFTISVRQLILNTGQVRNVYCSLNIIQAMKPRTMRAAGYVARMGEKRDAY